jgi:hypothetical protein
VIINDPAVIAEVRDAFERYEAALLANDSAALDGFFLKRVDTVRYGVAELQYGIDEIRAFRAQQRPFARQLERLVITSFGTDFAIASTLFHRPDFPRQIGRQQQSWVRTEDGWQIAAAHVSMMPTPSET